MIKIDNVLVSEDFLKEFFCCDLNSCLGACCVEGEEGAPLEESELLLIENKLEQIRPHLSLEALTVLDTEGLAVRGVDGDWATPTINGKECIYSYSNEKGILKCSFERVWDGTDSDFKKPISCHLYPARETQLFGATALNYHKWEICSSACEFGKTNKIPLYKFLQNGFERKYGKDWYLKLSEIIEELKKRAEAP